MTKKSMPINQQLSTLGTTVGAGVAMGAVGAVGDVFTSAAGKLAQSSPAVASVLEDPVGREVVKAALAAGIRTACYSTETQIPGKQAVAAACDMQVAFSVGRLTSRGLHVLVEELGQLAKVGESLPKDVIDADFIDVESKSTVSNDRK